MNVASRTLGSLKPGPGLKFALVRAVLGSCFFVFDLSLFVLVFPSLSLFLSLSFSQFDRVAF